MRPGYRNREEKRTQRGTSGRTAITMGPRDAGEQSLALVLLEALDHGVDIPPSMIPRMLPKL